MRKLDKLWSIILYLGLNERNGSDLQEYQDTQDIQGYQDTQDIQGYQDTQDIQGYQDTPENESLEKTEEETISPQYIPDSLQTAVSINSRFQTNLS